MKNIEINLSQRDAERLLQAIGFFCDGFEEEIQDDEDQEMFNAVEDLRVQLAYKLK